ncbi:MAG: pyridoxal phosphate-dependent aminotransferase [Acidimicrobiales bacterium]
MTETLGLERWFAAAGTPPRLDLARSGASPITTADLLAVTSPEAIQEYLGLPLGYGPGQGTWQLRQAIARTGAARSADQVVVTHGAIEALLLACLATLGGRRQVAVATPAYEGLLRAPELAGAEVAAVPVWRSGRASLELAGFDGRLLRGCGAVLLNVPHNPTGLVPEPDEFADLAERCIRCGTLLVVDEVAQGTLDPSSTSLAQSRAFDSGALVVIGDVSKALGLGGLRIGWLSCANPGLVARACSLKDSTTLGNAAPSQWLARLALEHRAELGVAQLSTECIETLRSWLDTVPGASWLRPRDGLVAFPRFELGVPSATVSAHLRANAGVSVLPGSLFGVEGHLRLSLGQRPGDLEEGLAWLGHTLDELAVVGR